MPDNASLDPSELRLLSDAHANDEIDSDTYRSQRRALIESIERGDTAIRRIAQPPPLARPARRARWSLRAAMLGLLIGALALGAALYHREPERPSSEPSTTPREVSAPRQQISPARGLVEEFLTHRDFSPQALDEFRRRWNELTRAERARARAASWFADLGSGIDAEIRTQLALAELGTRAPARERAAALSEFATALEIELPAATPPTDTASAAETERLVSERQSLAGADWLAIQNADRLTLQLFAVNALDHVARLMDRYPRVEMHVLDSAGASPRYRIVHGSFDAVDEAEAAYRALPEDLRALSKGAIVKSIAALREDLATPAGETALSAAGTTIAAGADTSTSASYTLQLFATASASNAEALIAAFPALELERATVVDSPSPHRVILGRFDSMDAARSARDALPDALLSRIGRPLIKDRESLGLP